MSPEQMVGSLSETILDKFGEKKFDVEDIVRSLEEAGPYQNVFMQVLYMYMLYIACWYRNASYCSSTTILRCQERGEFLKPRRNAVDHCLADFNVFGHASISLSSTKAHVVEL